MSLEDMAALAKMKTRIIKLYTFTQL